MIKNSELKITDLTARAVTPTHHWLEYVDWAKPVLKEPLQIDSGFVQVPDRPGSGVEWDEQSVEKYLVNL